VMEKSKMVAGKWKTSLQPVSLGHLGDFMLPVQSFKPYAVQYFFTAFANRM
jgi:hypothetical protein